MRFGKLTAFTAGLLAASATTASAQMDLRKAPARAEVIAGQFICVFGQQYALARNSVGAEARFAARDSGGVVGRVFSHSIRGFVVRASEQGVRRMLSQNPNISYCEPDQVMRIDPQAPPPGRGPNKDGGGGDASDPQSTPWGIARVGGPSGSATGKAWVIDSGIDLDHPDLNVDTGLSKDFTGSRNGAEDENGHGTHVAGTIAAIDNDFGVVGVAAGATVIAVRVLNRRGSGSYSDVIAGVDYVAQNGSNGDVANMSLGGPYSQALNDAVFAASGAVKFALAAGNSGADAGNYSPASANGNAIYTVSAFSQGDNWASFSNYGNPPVDYAEPGVSVESTWKNGSYNTISGTSMASPHMAGILLLGTPDTAGTVNNDPDGNPDPIGVR